LFDLNIRHQPYSEKPLEEQVAAALRLLLDEGLDGDTLVFLPGGAEIRRAARACQGLAAKANLLLAPLHGDLSPEEQDRAVLPSGRRKVILSTNVAESSVTIEGVRAVIDSGLARVASDSPWTGLATLQVARVSQASATQRAGRAGRTGPGKVLRLFSAEDFARRAAHETPEIARRELSQAALDLRAMGIRGLPWFEPPPEAAVAAAEELLARLGALDARGALTELGKRMARLPLHPRLARLVLEAEKRGAGQDGCEIAALLSSGERLAPGKVHAGPSDLLLLLDSPRAPRTRQIAQQIRRAVRPAPQKKRHEEALLLAILAAFPDRVAKRRQANELQLASGGPATLAAASVVRADLLVAADVEERREQGPPIVRLASAIQPEWLLDLFPEGVSEKREIEWNKSGERVEEVSALLYDRLVIEESRGVPADQEAASRMLAEKAWEAGVARFSDPEEIDRFLVRVAFGARHSAIPSLDDTDVRAALETLCHGRRSFAELRAAAGGGGLLAALELRLPPAARRILQQAAPERIKLPGGRATPVNYAVDQPPWIASRLQDFFGLRETPRVAGGKVPVVVHLLAPNRRPVQMTSDLAGFWERLYPQVRRELSRRYPKHSWPENPR
jgi:ATP-dependent helicase HrpB